jgi:tetratricopeptide (TPR) repeat protein
MRTLLSILILSTAAFAAADFNSLIEHGRISLRAFDLDSAQADYAQACPAEKLAAFPLQKIAVCENESGALAEARGQSDEAGNHYRKALAGWVRLGSPYLAHQITTLTNLGGVYRREHRLAEAEKVLGQAVELAGSLPASSPELYSVVIGRSAALYSDLDQPDRARPMLNEAITGLRSLTPPNAPELAYAYNALGMLDLNTGRYQSGESNFRQAVGFAAESLGESSPETAAYSTNLALALLVQGQYSRAGTLLRRARLVVESRLGPDSIQLVNVLAELGSVETRLGRFRIAEDCDQKALEILSRHLPPDSLEIVLLKVNMGNLYLREHRNTEAEKILPAAVEAERRLLKDGRTLGDGIRNLAELRDRQHVWNEAESLFREAIGLYERKLGAEHPDIAPVLREYAGVLKHKGASRAEVASLEARARAIESKAPHSVVS